VCFIAGYQWTDIAGCVEWMSAFAAVLYEKGPTLVNFTSRVTPAEARVLQTWTEGLMIVIMLQVIGGQTSPGAWNG